MKRVKELSTKIYNGEYSKEEEKIEEYVKQIKDLWNKPNQKHFRDYFEATKVYLIIGTGSKIGKRKVTNKLFSEDEKTISSTVKKLKIKK